jgi:hypothetical protein
MLYPVVQDLTSELLHIFHFSCSKDRNDFLLDKELDQEAKIDTTIINFIDAKSIPGIHG